MKKNSMLTMTMRCAFGKRALANQIDGQCAGSARNECVNLRTPAHIRWLRIKRRGAIPRREGMISEEDIAR